MMLKARLPARLTPLAAAFGFEPFYGDIHNHCALSYGHGRPEDALARAGRQLDFVSLTGHAAWPDMPDDVPAPIKAFHIEGFARLRRQWAGHFDLLRAAEAKWGMTVYPGYEIHSNTHGDQTILYRDLEPREPVIADSPATLLAALEQAAPGGFMAFPHHPGYRLGARGINWASLEPGLSPVVEIVSMHGVSETCLTARPYLHSMGPSDGHSTHRHGLALGHDFGFVGNTDHHSGYPGSYGHGRTCLMAPSRGRDDLWQALWQRRATALTGDCAHLCMALGEAGFTGSVIAPGGTGQLAIEAVGGSAIDCIDVVRNGALVARVSPAIDPSPIGPASGPIETLLVLEIGWGARQTRHRWRGSLALDGGEILAVEPRLRGAEIVSPLEGEADAPDTDALWLDGQALHFDITAAANPNNRTATTQAIALRVRLDPGARVLADLDGKALQIAAERLFEGALAGNLGPIDSPAYRFHPLPRPAEWQWQGELALPPLTAGEHLYLRMRQANDQWAWASPIFCRERPRAGG
jgi:hypothetical protein